MWTYILKRLLLMIPTVIGAAFLIFFLLRALPGDVCELKLGGEGAYYDEEQIKICQAQLGIDQPLYVQLGLFLGDLVTLDLGRSFRTHEKITTEILQRFPATCELTFASMLIAVLGGVSLGIVAALRRGRAADYLGMILATGGISMPIFWLGLMLILLLAVWLPVFPVSGRLASHIFLPPRTHFYLLDAILAGDGRALLDLLRHLALPALTLSTVPLAVIARLTRASLLEVLGEDYIRTAWAKGLTGRLVVWRHAVRNAFIPTLTVIGMEFGYLLGGAVITETVFAWPGLGRWLFFAVQARDLRAVQGGVLLLASLFILLNLLADLLYAWLDPRIRYDR